MVSVIQHVPAPKSRTGEDSIAGFKSEIIAPRSYKSRPVSRPLLNGSHKDGSDIKSRLRMSAINEPASILSSRLAYTRKPLARKAYLNETNRGQTYLRKSHDSSFS